MAVDRATNSVSGLSFEERTVMRYLQEAWAADRRWGRRNPEKARAAYELLINYRPMRQRDLSPDTLNGRVKEFAKDRLDYLGSRGN